MFSSGLIRADDDDDEEEEEEEEEEVRACFVPGPIEKKLKFDCD